MYILLSTILYTILYCFLYSILSFTTLYCFLLLLLLYVDCGQLTSILYNAIIPIVRSIIPTIRSIIPTIRSIIPIIRSIIPSLYAIENGIHLTFILMSYPLRVFSQLFLTLLYPILYGHS